MTDEQIKYWITDGASIALLILMYFGISCVRGGIQAYYRNEEDIRRIKQTFLFWWMVNRIRIKIMDRKLLYSGFGTIVVINLKTFKVTHSRFWFDKDD